MGLFSKALQDNQDEKEFKGGRVEVRGHSLLVGNQIYQIPNISTISVLDLSSDRPIPKLCPFLTIGGVLAAMANPREFGVLGIFVAILAGAAWIYYAANRRESRFALTVLMNAGNRLMLLSGDFGFLKRMALALNDAISSNRSSNFTFNLDQRQIFDNIKNSSINTGTVSGDIVNNV